MVVTMDDEIWERERARCPDLLCMPGYIGMPRSGESCLRHAARRRNCRLSANRIGEHEAGGAIGVFNRVRNIDPS